MTEWDVITVLFRFASETPTLSDVVDWGCT